MFTNCSQEETFRGYSAHPYSSKGPIQCAFNQSRNVRPSKILTYLNRVNSPLQKRGKTGNELLRTVRSGIVWVDKIALLDFGVSMKPVNCGVPLCTSNFRNSTIYVFTASRKTYNCRRSMWR